jgi:gas vesicle protein
MQQLKGGRGKKAPYQSTHCRIPEPIKPTVELLALTYRDLIANGHDCQELLEVVEAAIDEVINPSSGTKHREKALRRKLEKMTADRDRQLIRISELQNRIAADLKRAYDNANKTNERLEAWNQQLDRANGYLEKQNRLLREQLESKNSFVKSE